MVKQLKPRHPERSEAESKDPEALRQSDVAGFLDFARNDVLSLKMRVVGTIPPLPDQSLVPLPPSCAGRHSYRPLRPRRPDSHKSAPSAEWPWQCNRSVARPT